MFGDYQSCEKMYTFERIDGHTISWYGERMSEIFFREVQSVHGLMNPSRLFSKRFQIGFDENVNSVNLFSFWVRVG